MYFVYLYCESPIKHYLPQNSISTKKPKQSHNRTIKITMKFRTEINLPNYPFSIAYPNNIFSIGSCFASNMANQLQRLKFQVTDNPYGTLFNPISIANGLNLLLHNYEFSEHDLFTHQGLWHSYHHHSSFSGIDQTAVLNHLQYNSQQARTHLLNSDRILITLGSAYVHQHTTWGGIVANCHKLPANQFTKSKLGVSDITSAFVPVLEALKAQLPNLAILLTVSPVRHIKEGLVENQRSKATLLLAAEALCQFDFVHYFPPTKS